MADRPRRSRKKILIWSVIALLVVAAVSAKVISGKREKPILITTEKAVRTNITEIVTATGKIQPEVEVKIAPEVSGEIIEMPVKEGQLVRPFDAAIKSTRSYHLVTEHSRAEQPLLKTFAHWLKSRLIEAEAVARNAYD